MPILGKATKSARNFLGSDAGQALLSTLSIFVPGDPYGFVQRRNRGREQEAAMQQQRNAIGGLLDQFQPDTQTPQVNELIGEANLAGRGRFNPMAQMQAKAPAFDFTSPQGQAALMNALGAGVSLDGISGLRDFLSPKRNTTKLGENDTLVDDDGNVVGQGRMKPMEPQKRSTDSVVADIAYRYSRGEQISPREMELYRLWSAQERKQGQWAPNVSGAPGPRPTGRRVTF